MLPTWYMGIRYHASPSENDITIHRLPRQQQQQQRQIMRRRTYDLAFRHDMPPKFVLLSGLASDKYFFNPSLKYVCKPTFYNIIGTGDQLFVNKNMLVVIFLMHAVKHILAHILIMLLQHQHASTNWICFHRTQFLHNLSELILSISTRLFLNVK